MSVAAVCPALGMAWHCMYHCSLMKPVRPWFSAGQRGTAFPIALGKFPAAAASLTYGARTNDKQILRSLPRVAAAGPQSQVFMNSCGRSNKKGLLYGEDKILIRNYPTLERRRGRGRNKPRDEGHHSRDKNVMA